MESRIRLKLGSIEIEFEGSEEFLSNNLTELISNVFSLYESNRAVQEEADQLPPPTDEKPRDSTFAEGLSVGTIAGRLNVNTGRDFVLAACAYLAIGKGDSSFTRQDILTSMKSATSYYKQSHSKNLGKSLQQLIKNGDLLEFSTKRYSLSANTKNSLEKKLAQ